MRAWPLSSGPREQEGMLENPQVIPDPGPAAALEKSWIHRGPALSFLGGSANQELLWSWIPWRPLRSFGSPIAIRGFAPTPANGAKEAGDSYLLYSIIQGALLLAVISLAAYRFYAPTFVGKTEELIGIFLVAFSLDLTVDSVTSIKDKNTRVNS